MQTGGGVSPVYSPHEKGATGAGSCRYYLSRRVEDTIGHLVANTCPPVKNAGLGVKLRETICLPGVPMSGPSTATRGHGYFRRKCGQARLEASLMRIRLVSQ